MTEPTTDSFEDSAAELLALAQQLGATGPRESGLALVEAIGDWVARMRQVNLITDELNKTFQSPRYRGLFEDFVERIGEPSLSLSGIVIPTEKVHSGLLIQAVSKVWREVAFALGRDWSRAYSIPPEKWEELIAGAFHMAGYDEVILTPRSGDHGRDVIAVRHGVGSVKIIGSVKAYKPGHLVGYDDVRALLGVMSAERDTSKGIITTTSDFPPRIESDPFIKPFMPTRLELINGAQLQDWLLKLANEK